MLLTRTRQLYFPIRTSGGGGLYNYSIEGRGLFQDSTKTIGKKGKIYALFGLQPRAIKTGNEGLRKQLLDENRDKNQDKIQKVISDESKEILGKLLKKKKSKITDKSKEILEKLIYGNGLKLLK